MNDKNDKEILIIDDNIDILLINKRILLEKGFMVTTAMNLAEAEKVLCEMKPDLIVLDIMLPDGSGFDFIERIKEITNAPILILTSLNQKDNLIKGLRMGGDDYIAKPYDIDEFVERINALLRRTAIDKESAQTIIEMGPITMDTIEQIIYLNGKKIALTHKEYSLLLLFMQNQGKPLSTEYIYKKIWGQPILTDSRALWKQISNLKRKLIIEKSNISIKSSPKDGYTLIIEE